MEFKIEYNKNKGDIFKTLDNYDIISDHNIQNYTPLYNLFFELNDTNYNNINLNTNYTIVGFDSRIDHNLFLCSLKNTENIENSEIKQKEVFIKFSPLLDPTKYITGKYDLTPDLFKLPKLNNNNCHEKSSNIYNSAYVDSFFSFISSKMLKHHGFLHGIDFYGNFLCNQKDYKVNIYDDVEYLIDSPFFFKNKDILFSIDDSFYEEMDDNESRNNKKKINIQDPIEIQVNEFDDKLYNDIFVKTDDELTIFNLNQLQETEFLQTNLETEYSNIKSRSNSINSSSCSSRTSNTDDEVSSLEYEDEDDDSQYSSEDDSDDEEEEIFAYIEHFPVNMICLEKCKNTLDNYMLNNEVENKEWAGIFMQIIMTLLVYQKCFHFTHNDLHTNNVMYIETDKQNLFYHYNNNYYKVPTFGKIWKIIDFGRAIYKFKGNIIGSDSFSPNGDASTQYNCEPFFDSNKPRLEANFSFDLCRFGCSLFDFFIEDIEDKTVKYDMIDKLIIEWCSDDNNKNILYKKNGEERYPDFKLYKMIARNVHNHTPQNQLKKDIFSNFTIGRKKLNKNNKILYIDKLPCYI